jgi:anti-sigma factor RsiW
VCVSLLRRIEHLRYRRYLDAALDDELSGHRARRVRAHMSACPLCARDEDLTIVIKRRLGLFHLLRPPSRRHHTDER